jgi:acyl-coenzyme A thioesterase PaaI-like protein
VTVRPELLNQGGILSGVVAFTLIDYGMGSTLWPHTSEAESIATPGISITYLRTARAGDLVCRSTLDRRTRSNAALRSEVAHEGTGELIATAVGTYAIFTRAKTKPS